MSITEKLRKKQINIEIVATVKKYSFNNSNFSSIKVPILFYIYIFLHKIYLLNN